MGNGNFARGFMETFPRAAEAASQRKQDAWEKLWKKYDENQEQFRKGEQESKAVERKAKEYIATYDTEGKLPEGAEAVIANKIMSGFSDKQIQDLIQNGKWGVTDVPAGQVNPADEREQQQNVDQQTAGAMGLEAPQMAPEKPQGILGSVVAKGQDFVQQMALSPQEKAMKRFAQETGMTPDQVKQMMARGTMQQVPSAQERWDKASAGITVKAPPPEPQGNPNSIWNRLNQNESQVLMKAMEKTQNNTNKIESSKSSLKTVAKMVSDNIDIVNEVPAVSSYWVKNGATFVSRMTNEFNSLFSITGKGENASISANNPEEVRSKIIELEEGIQSLESNPAIGEAEKIARAAALFDMRVRLSAYTLAESYQQSGRSLSNEERKIFEEILSGGLSPDKYLTNMKSLMQIQMQRIKFDTSALANDVFIQQGQLLAPDVIRVPNADILTDPDVAGTPLQKDFEKILNYNSGGLVQQPQQAPATQPQQVQQPSGYKKVGKTKSGLPVFEDAQGNRFIGQ